MKQYDVLAMGVAAVDDLLYVASYPSPNEKVPVSARERHGGGPACTAIATVSTLHGRSAFVARLGKDDLSTYIETILKERGVDTSHIVRDLAAEPYHCSIVVDLMGNRNVFYEASRFVPLTPEDVPESLLCSAELVLLDHVADPAMIAVAEKIRRLGIPIVGDIEGRSESGLQMTNSVDHLVVPAEFALWASGSSTSQEACAYLAQTERLTTVVTAGSDGCYYSIGSNGQVAHVPAFQVESFDTNGCGDTFHGAFALGIARSFSPPDAIIFASASAAIKASAGHGGRRGWNALPTLDEVVDLMRLHAYGSTRPDLLERIIRLKRAQPKTAGTMAIFNDN